MTERRVRTFDDPTIPRPLPPPMPAAMRSFGVCGKCGAAPKIHYRANTVHNDRPSDAQLLVRPLLTQTCFRASHDGEHFDLTCSRCGFEWMQAA